MLKTVSTQLALASDTLPEVLAKGNTTGGTDLAVSAGDDITLADNSKVIFGAGSDLSIYSDGATGQVTGNVSITGTLTADGLTVEGDISLTEPSPTITFTDTSDSSVHLVQSINTALNVQGQSQVRLSTAATERVRVNSNGDVSFYNTDGSAAKMVWDASAESLVFSGTGGVYLGGTAAANLLDDYEEGTFTHALTCGTSGTITVSGAYNTGSYVKVGNKVTAQGLIILSAVSSPVGVLNISLPFVAATGSEREFDTAATVVINNSVANTAGSYVAYVVTNTQTIQVFEGDSASLGLLSANQIQASSQIWYNVTYRAV